MEEGSAEASGSAEKLMLELCLVPWIHQALLPLVIDVTICKHSVEVLDTFLSIPVIVVFQALLYCSHIHGCFNNLIVIREVQLDGIHGLLERPRKLVFP